LWQLLINYFTQKPAPPGGALYLKISCTVKLENLHRYDSFTVQPNYALQMEPEIRQAPTRFYEIDLLRFLAAFSVVIYHYTYRGFAAGNYSPIPFTELGRFTRYGYLGVELFFLISGYVVLLSTQGKTIRQFFISRVTRLYPAFWAACTLTFLVKCLWGTGSTDAHMSVYLHSGIGQYFYNMTMLYGFLGITPVDSAYWSLTVEITFYVLISLLVAYDLMRHINLFIALWLAYTALPLIGIRIGGKLLPDIFFPEYAPYFAAGMLFYLLQQESTLMRYGLLLVAYLLSIRAGILEMHKMADLYQEAFSPVVVGGVITCFFGLFILIIKRIINLSRFSWLAWLGALTYPLYLVHQDIGFVIFHRAGALANKYAVLSGLLLLMVTTAYLIHTLVEKRVGKPLGQYVGKRLHYLDSKAY
jgi:peptidoglycan/LPS O-acetylase OafA/YrhL